MYPRQWFSIHDHIRPIETLQPSTINVTVVCGQLKMVQVFFVMTNNAIEIKCINYHLLCPMKCSSNGVMINTAYKLLAPVPSEAIYAIQVHNTFNAIQQVIISLMITVVTSFFDVMKPTQKEYGVTREPLWNLPSPELSQLEHSMLY